MNKVFVELRNSMRDAIRAEAAKILDFDCGAIILSFIGKCELANEFLDDPCKGGDGRDNDFAYKVRPDRPMTRPNGFRGVFDGERACRGCATLKLESCSYAVGEKLGRRSCDTPDSSIALGRLNERGAVCFDVNMEDGTPFFRSYISVDGASSEENERCALAAASVLRKWVAEKCHITGEKGHIVETVKFVLIEPEDVAKNG